MQQISRKKAFRSRSGRPQHPRVSGGSLSYTPIPRNYLSKHVAGVAQSIRRTLSWAANGGVNGISSGYSELAVTILNGPYDPDAALGGLSASGFAKYMALYSKCFALGAKVRIKGAFAGAGYEGIPTDLSIIGSTITTNGTSLGSAIAAIQAGLCQYDVVNVNPNNFEFNLSVDVAKFVDVPDILDNNLYSTTVSANPSQIIVNHLWLLSPSVLATCSVNYIVEVEMDCVFTDPIPFT